MSTDKRQMKIDYNGNVLHDPIDTTGYKVKVIRGTVAPQHFWHDLKIDTGTITPVLVDHSKYKKLLQKAFVHNAKK